MTVTHKSLSLSNAKRVPLDLTFKLSYDSPLGREMTINNF